MDQKDEIQTTSRQRPTFRQQSRSSDASEDKTSGGSRKSGAKSGRKSMTSSEMGAPVVRGGTKRLKLREYLLLLIEASLAMSVYVIRERHSAWVSLVIGCLADSYFRHYTMALFSVILHFAVVSIVFMEDTVRRNQDENPYAVSVWNVCVVALVLIRSTDFTRLIYGLEGITNRKMSTICLFIFLHFWVSSYGTYGGIVVNTFSFILVYSNIKTVVVAFVLGGISLFLFVYLLYPETHLKENRGLGCAVLGCLLLATYYKILRIRKRGRRGFFGNTEGTYNKTTISKTKEILLLYALLLPSFAVALTIMAKGNLFYESAIRAVKTEPFLEKVGLRRSARAILSIAMLLSYFVLWPLLRLVGFKNRNTSKLIVGHLLVTSYFFYAAFLTKLAERLQHPKASGYVRVFNTREKPVYFIPEDLDFTTHSFDVSPLKGQMVAYPCWKETLFAMRVVFNGTNINYTTFLSVTPGQTTGYVVVEPPELIRIRGPVLPIQEGPPGTNQLVRARMYIYNTAKTLEGATIKMKFAHKRYMLRQVVIQPGIMTTISLEPAIYDFSILEADIKQTFAIEEGALYGMILYSTLSSREMVIDTVVGPDTLSPWPLLGLFFVIGLANGLCYPALRAIIFITAPHGLMGMSFAFLSFLEGMALWFMYIGYRTWHYFVTGNVLFVYSGGIAVFFCFCLFVVIKYKNQYK